MMKAAWMILTGAALFFTYPLCPGAAAAEPKLKPSVTTEKAKDSSDPRQFRKRLRPRAATMGVRGLRGSKADPNDSKYPPDIESLERMEAYEVAPTELKKFEGTLQNREPSATSGKSRKQKR